MIICEACAAEYGQRCRCKLLGYAPQGMPLEQRMKRWSIRLEKVLFSSMEELSVVVSLRAKTAEDAIRDAKKLLVDNGWEVESVEAQC